MEYFHFKTVEMLRSGDMEAIIQRAKKLGKGEKKLGAPFKYNIY
jgi:hypothetical protein